MPSKISDAFINHPIHHNQKHLDLNSLQELPDSHAWTFQDDFPSADPSQSNNVPIIDLHLKNAQESIGHACKTWGVFQVVNHGIPKTLLDDIQSSGMELFSLPLHQKLKGARSPNGVSGYGVARISSFFPKLMWSEGFTILGSPLEHARKIWPHDYTKFCELIETYEKEMKKLAWRLMWLTLGSLGINDDDVKWASPKGTFDGACAALQLNSYPACPEPDRAMGLAAHTDSSILTILHQNGTRGLEVLQEGLGWVTVPPLPGALVVNVGDLLHILSNGLYHSVRHRAMVNRTHHRFSIAYIYGPPAGVKISPVQKLLDQGHPPLYKSVTWSEYLGTKAKHFDKALSAMRLCLPLNGFGDAKNDHNRVVVG